MTGETLHQFEAERKALHAVLASGTFPPSSNPARLLTFLCEKHFEDPGRELTEYDIAMGALGRRSDFDPRRDSVVRVEVHRLRKRLKEFYAAEGSSLATQIVLPMGQYAPQFLNLAEPEVKTEAPPPVPALAPKSSKRLFMWLGLAAAGLLFVGVWEVRNRQGRVVASKPAAVIPAVGDLSEVRLLAGFPSGRFIDQHGHRWTGDEYFQGGSAIEVVYGHLRRTEDAALYQHARRGFEFSYHIPLKPGTYEMRLYFAESSIRVPIVGESGESSRRFRVMANGKQLLPPPDGRHVSQFDIFSDTGGEDLADVKVFKDITPAPDGKLHLNFLTNKQQAQINAIEILPGEPGKLHTIRLCAAGRPILDSRGNLWLPDELAQGGRLSAFNRPVTGTDSPALFQGERFGHFTYTIPVVPGRYTVSLGFAENFHTIWDRSAGKGARLFNVYLNGVLRLRDFDVYARAGGPLNAIVRTFRDVEPTPQDKIMITFEPVNENAIVNTVEITDQGVR